MSFFQQPDSPNLLAKPSTKYISSPATPEFNVGARLRHGTCEIFSAEASILKPPRHAHLNIAHGGARGAPPVATGSNHHRYNSTRMPSMILLAKFLPSPVARGPVLGGSKAAYRAQAIMEMRIRNGVRKFAPKHWIIVCHDYDGYDYHRRRGYNAATVLALATMVTCTFRGIVYD